MVRNLLYGMSISFSLYIILTMFVLMFTRSFDLELIKMWGFGLFLLLFLSSFPLYKAVYHGGKVANPTYTTYVPPDEHHHHTIQKNYDSSKKRNTDHLQGILIWSSVFMLLITILLAVLF
ncbi:hypothetical protein [Alkalihalobacterium bogoriense]|uniref:hypothetical protein n=1 Tax=Alkalihalobacterium bogoriense TaxID=246272 RepID=UPI00047C1DE5|nr:hypothetical protein [Alkalihalobacterium bogoriense]